MVVTSGYTMATVAIVFFCEKSGFLRQQLADLYEINIREAKQIERIT